MLVVHKRGITKHSLRLKYLRLQRKKINKRIQCEIMALKRITGIYKTRDMLEVIKSKLETN